jgi:hypothetical protein
VVDWYMQDFNGRSLAGNYSAEQVIARLGSPAAKVLVNGLKARVPQQALVKMAAADRPAGRPRRARTRAARIVADRARDGGQGVPGLGAPERASQAERSGIKLEGRSSNASSRPIETASSSTARCPR